MSLEDDDAARRALVSSGVVGLTTALLTKGFGVDLEVSLPVALATGISLDYVVNRRRARRDKEKEFEAITITGNAIGDFIKADLGESVTHSAWGQEYDGGVWQAQLLTGVIGLLAGGTMALRGYDVFFDEPRHQVGIIGDPQAQLGRVGWGLYRAVELANDFGGIAQGVYGMLRPRMTTVLRAVSDWFGSAGGGRGLTEQEIADRVAEVFPEADIELNQVLQNRADDIMRGRTDARLIVPPGSDFDDLLGDLPGVPQVGVAPGRIMLMRRDDNSEVAMIWESASQTTRQSIGVSKTDSGFSVSGRIVPVVNLPEADLREIARIFTDLDVRALTREAAHSAYEDEQARLHGTGRSTSSEETTDD